MAVTIAELEAALRDPGVILVDVLSPESFAASHVPGAINIPVADLTSRAAAELPDPSRRIIVYCGGPT